MRRRSKRMLKIEEEKKVYLSLPKFKPFGELWWEVSGFSDQRGLWGRQNRKGEKKQVGCEKGITPQRRRLRVIMDEGAQNGERKGRGFFRHQVRSRLFFIFFDLYFFFFVSFLLLFMEPGRWACLFVRLLRACRDPWIFFFSGPHLIRSLRPAQGSANGCKPFTPGRKKKQICHFSKQKKNQPS